jgi:hypothetical protein
MIIAITSIIIIRPIGGGGGRGCGSGGSSKPTIKENITLFY